MQEVRVEEMAAELWQTMRERLGWENVETSFVNEERQCRS
jgi:hypothetical protein